MKKKLITIGVALLLLIGGFAIGTQASTWLTYTGDGEQIESDVDEIMDILRQVNEDKLTAEEALAELEAMNPPGLVKKIKKLEEEIEQLKSENANLATTNAALEAEISHLEAELKKANEEVDNISNKTTDALNEARELINN